MEGTGQKSFDLNKLYSGSFKNNLFHGNGVLKIGNKVT